MEVAIEGPGAFAVNVVGVSQYQRVLEAAAEAGVVDAVLMREDDNAYDDQAVAVLNDLLDMPGHEEMADHYLYGEGMGLLNQKIGSQATRV